jgi:hypothetical protein
MEYHMETKKPWVEGDKWAPEPLGPVAEYLAATVIFSDYKLTPETERLMASAVGKLDDLGFTIRTTGPGASADCAHKNAKNVEIYVPYKKTETAYFGYSTRQAVKITERYLPTLDEVRETVRPVPAMYTSAVLGKWLNSRAQVVVYWSSDSALTLEKSHPKNYANPIFRICLRYQIPLFNLNDTESMFAFKAFLDAFAKDPADIPPPVITPESRSEPQRDRNNYDNIF